MVVTFKLCSEQLSSQDHYDYGMRAVKSVIDAAGNLKRAEPDANEDSLLLRALRDVNVPKFLGHDLPLFENIISDLFPGIERPNVDYGNLNERILEQCEKYSLISINYFIEKIYQLYDTIKVRHGLMLVGPAGGGKSSNVKVLRDSITLLAPDMENDTEEEINNNNYRKTTTKFLNPKSITMGQLYGEYDEYTHEWTDGIVPEIIRLCTRDKSDNK